MKKFLLILLVAIVSAANVFAQTPTAITEAHITYTLSAPNNPQAAQMIDGSTTTITLKDSMVRLDVSSSMVQSKIIMDLASGKGTMLMELMGTKYAVTFSPEDTKKDLDTWDKSYDVKFIDSTKVIGTHACKKAVVTIKDGKKESTVWYDPAIPVSISVKGMYSKIKYLQVQYETEQRGVVVLSTLTGFDTKPVDNSVFTVSTDGYTVMSYDDFKQAMGGMGGH